MNLEQEHRKVLLKNLSEFRIDDCFADVTILVQGVRFKAHKVILAASSAYFRSMFSADGMLECRENVANIVGVNVEGFATLLAYIYTAQLTLTPLTVQEVLSTAAYLQVDPVIDFCAEYLRKILDSNNCTDISIIADTYSLTDLQEVVSKFIDAHFIEIAKNNMEGLHKLTPEQIQSVVSKDMTICVTELDFLRYILTWFLKGRKSEYKIKCAYAEDILRYIRFFEITPKDLNIMIDAQYSSCDLKKDECPVYKTLLRISNKPENLLRVPISKHQFNKRGMQLAIVKIGGFDKGGLTNNINYCFINERHWKSLTVIPHVEQCNYGNVVLNNELYIVGGCFNDLLQEVIHPYAFVYNPWLNTWTKICSMTMDRCRFTLNALNGKIYAVAGATGAEETKTAERYDVTTRQWSLIEGLPESRQRHASCTFAHSIFVSGGLQKDRVIASMFVYDETKNCWSSCAPLLTPRADHFMICFGEKIYVCGGWRDDDADQSTRVQVPTIDAYDVHTNTWSFVTTVPTPRYHAGIVADDSKIYFVGGFHTDAVFNRDIADIECYDIAKNTWTRDEKNSQNFWEHSCVTMYIPKHRMEQ